MPDFTPLRDGLNGARGDRDAAQRALVDAHERRVRVEGAYAAARRVVSARTDGTLEELRAQLDEARRDEETKRSALMRHETAVTGHLRAFGDVADPRTGIGQWSGETPILLFPVRLETRFHRTENEREELWVRVYPDDCAVDTFEASLSDTELASGRRYWIETWAASGIVPQRRAAWRNLVASHGSGRAAWILHEYTPAAAEPVKARPDDIVLTIATDAPPAAAAREALRAYWTAVWRAEGDRAAIEAAAAALANTPGVGDPAQLVAAFVPANFDASPASPLTRADVAVDTQWLVLPTVASLKTRSWTMPARVTILPERFVVIGYQAGSTVFEALGAPIPSPLVVGPDPAAPADQQIRHDAAGNLVLPDDMRWIADFDRAVAVGMGLKIALDPARVDLTKPIDRVVAVGLRLADDAGTGRSRLEELLEHHRYGQGGLALVLQGTPTNNTEPAGSGYSGADDTDASYDALNLAPAGLQPTADWWHRRDGQWLADALGIDSTILRGVAHAAGTDTAAAQALNRALWPATFGYAMETMLHPIFGQSDLEATRWFFTHFVTGRGLLPSVRIGDQPYGVLPISALSQWKWIDGETTVRVAGLDPPARMGRQLHGLAAVLGAMRADWTQLANTVSRIGGAGDPHQALLDVVGLHPASIEFHQRFAESLSHLLNHARLRGVGSLLLEHVRQHRLQQDARDLLARLGYRGTVEPDALQRFFFTRAHRLNGPLIDDRPLSEVEAIRPYTPDGRNYVAWLEDVVSRSFEDLRAERGFIDDRAPDALLYVMLRHALLLGYWDAALRLHESSGVVTGDAVKLARREPVTIHLAESATSSESRYAPLYSRDSRVSGAPERTVADTIRQTIGTAPAAAALRDQVAALNVLKDVPTAQLERCLAEHIDTASYRLDAWLLGLIHLQLASLRYRTADRPGEATHGIYLGAYGWLEHLHRKSAPLEPVTLDDELSAVFGPEATPLRRDPDSGGHLFAPSMDHATTAAILRAGYLANASRGAPAALGVNLSSARVRVALWLIEGIRNGQPLGALLGYRFQRGLHEHAALALDKFLSPLRQQFPLLANHIVSTQEPGVPIETVEANNVVDGLKLLEHVTKAGNRAYPFGLPLPPATAAERAAIDAQVDQLLDARDALADLALAEGVHQAVLGNFDAVASTFDAYSKGTHPPEPEVVRTPRSGTTLTHRVGLHFEAGVDPAVSPIVGLSISPRSRAQAMVNTWLASILPPPDEVGCQVTWIDPVAAAVRQELVTQRDLDLQPIDTLYLLDLDADVAMRELDDRVVRHVVNVRATRADAVVRVEHTTRLAPPIKSFFELAALVRHLRSLLLRSRPLAPTDLVLAGEATREQGATSVIARERVQAVADALEQLGQDLAAFDAGVGTIDQAIRGVADLFERAARFGIQQAGWGHLYEWRRALFAGVLDDMRQVIARWNERLATFDGGMTNYAADAPTLSVDARLALLASLDVLIAAEAVHPRPAVPADYEAALATRRQAFVDKRMRLEAIVATAAPGLSALLAALRAELPLTAFDRTPFPVDYTLPELRDRVQGFVDRWTDRLGRFDAGLAVYNALPAGTPDADRFTRLEELDLLVAAHVVAPRPPTPAAYVAEVGTRRAAFDAKRAQLVALMASTDPRPERFLVALRPALPLTPFDAAPLPLDKTEADVQRTLADVVARVAVLEDEVRARVAAAATQLLAHDATAEPAARVRALQGAGTALLGEDITLIPEFTFAADRAAELANAYGAFADGTLLNYLRSARGVDDPVDDWLHGVARVRDKMFAWEQAAAMSAAFGRPEPLLTPAQLPFSAGDGWLALEFDPAQTRVGERLLYTAHHPAAPVAAVATCGLLLDEWTEVVPSDVETAALAFHYDRPGSQPPQAWLLVTPPRLGGAWRWSDVLGAVDEALQLAQLRTVEPRHVDTLPYARFLPATTSAATLYGISIAANYGRINGAMAYIEGASNG
jgi:hypothetical protein